LLHQAGFKQSSYGLQADCFCLTIISSLAFVSVFL
jgi:hypothetical protein